MSDACSLQIFQDVPVFGGVSRDTLRFLLERGEPVTIGAGDYFFREGWQGRSAFVLETGSVSILKHHDGKEHLLSNLGQGDCFGEMALLDLGPRSASVRADSDCRAIELTAGDLHAVSQRSVEQFAILYMNVGRELSRRLRAANDRMFQAKLAGDPMADGYLFLAA